MFWRDLLSMLGNGRADHPVMLQHPAWTPVSETKLPDLKSSRLLFRLFNRGNPGAMVALVEGMRWTKIAGLKGAAA